MDKFNDPEQLPVVSASDNGNGRASSSGDVPKALIGYDFSFQHVNPKSIHPDPGQPRKTRDPKAQEELTTNVRAMGGVMTPLHVRPHPEKAGEFMVINGEGRWLAALATDLASVPVLVVRVDDPDEISRMQVVDNRVRSDISILEMGAHIDAYMQRHDCGQVTAAKHFLVSPTYVSNALNLHLRLPKAHKEELAAGRLSIDAALAKLPRVRKPKNEASSATAPSQEFAKERNSNGTSPAENGTKPEPRDNAGQASVADGWGEKSLGIAITVTFGKKKGQRIKLLIPVVKKWLAALEAAEAAEKHQTHQRS